MPWVLLALGLAAGLVGSPLGWYVALESYDEIVHGFTSFAIALLVSAHLAAVFGAAFGPEQHRALRAFLVVCVTMAVGTAWEIVEWAYDLVRLGDAIKGKWDTITDLTLDTAGGVAGALAGSLWHATPAPPRHLG